MRRDGLVDAGGADRPFHGLLQHRFVEMVAAHCAVERIDEEVGVAHGRRG